MLITNPANTLVRNSLDKDANEQAYRGMFQDLAPRILPHGLLLGAAYARVVANHEKDAERFRQGTDHKVGQGEEFSLQIEPSMRIHLRRERGCRSSPRCHERRACVSYVTAALVGTQIQRIPQNNRIQAVLEENVPMIDQWNLRY